MMVYKRQTEKMRNRNRFKNRSIDPYLDRQGWEKRKRKETYVEKRKEEKKLYKTKRNLETSSVSV